MTFPSTFAEWKPTAEQQAPVSIDAGGHASQERVKRQLLERHRFMLISSLIVLFMSWALSIHHAGHDATVTCAGFELPELCGSRAWFGVECPGCGLTRSFIALAAGQFTESFRYHRLGWLLMLAVVLQIPFRTYSLWELRTKTVNRRWPIWFGYFLILSLLGNWVLKAIGW